MRQLLLASLLLLGGCFETTEPVPPRGTGRCDVSLEDTDLFGAAIGTGARAAVLSEGDTGIGGPLAGGRAGDVLLENERLRLVVSQPGPGSGPLPFGGVVVDADLRRPAGEAGQDQLAGLGLLTAFGRTVEAEKLEVLSSGEAGGRAVVAVTGKDALNTALALQPRLPELLGEADATLVLDPAVALPLKSTTYLLLSPGEPRVRLLTALCNTGNASVTVPLGDLVAPGASLERFNPAGCTGTLGAEDCPVETAGVLGFQGDGVAYGYRSYQLADMRRPEAENTLLTVEGLSLTLASGKGRQGLLSWTNPQVTDRPGAVVVPGGGQQLFFRDLFVTRDLAELHSVLLALDNLPRSRLTVHVQDAGGAPLAGARVSVLAPTTSRLVTLMVSDASGVARGDLEPGGYHLVASLPGSSGEATRDVSVGSNGAQEVTLQLPPG